MDTLRRDYGAIDAADFGHDDDCDKAADDTPPPGIGTDERRMQVRAYNFWASLLEDRNLPPVEELHPEALGDFGPHSVLLDFSRGAEDPAIAYLGRELAGECDVGDLEIARLSDVPSRSLLSRITDHYMQIIANQAPIGFEAEFVNQRGSTILYRGILLPFSSDDESIDFIYGVINWKELADSHAADELLLEIDQALEARPAPAPRRHKDSPLTDWADGPGAAPANDVDEAADLPRPAFGLTRNGPAPDSHAGAAGETPTAAPDPADMALADWLAAAREMAQAARSGEERTRSALYEAIGRAWDFALAAAAEPAEFAALLGGAGLVAQDRAPMTPVVKLVFGADYDKTRLTEYAAALAYAERHRFARGALGDYLKSAAGGLKGVVAMEREYRRIQAGDPAPEPPRGPRLALAKKLRSLEPRDFSGLEQDGREFALVMIRRTETGEVVVLGEVPDNTLLVEKAARELLG